MYRGPLPPHLMPGPSGEYGYGMGPMDADEANEWLNAQPQNYAQGGYAAIAAALATENANRWGNAPGEAPAGNQLNFGPVTPGSDSNSWTWGPAPGLTKPGGTGGPGGGTGTPGAPGTPGGPLIDPVSGQPLETPDGRPIYNPNPTAPPAAPDGTGNLGNDVQPWWGGSGPYRPHHPDPGTYPRHGTYTPHSIPRRRFSTVDRGRNLPIGGAYGQRRTPQMRPMGRSNTYIT